MRIDELMTSPVLTVPADLSPKQVSRFLVEHRLGCAPVVDATGALIGIVTEADLMRLELHRDPTRHQRREHVEHAEPPPATIGQMMTSEVLAVPVDFDVADAARRMIDRHITRLQVGPRVALSGGPSSHRCDLSSPPTCTTAGRTCWMHTCRWRCHRWVATAAKRS